eukprot:Cvel_27568.t1-p1 / transcript=Cvel_27568.t1 / gene=Cvel_27568 / organism=Chromera_velia_CCMP2878 / gene_product=hypothetical protein / transcript_product=hypothetical protein / location=Cvel_scaffold3463:15174-17246(+) / protein_length=433 / sequence_SO=supercontig / SO=protein_coding / is_pseudo=false
MLRAVCRRTWRPSERLLGLSCSLRIVGVSRLRFFSEGLQKASTEDWKEALRERRRLVEQERRERAVKSFEKERLNATDMTSRQRDPKGSLRGPIGRETETGREKEEKASKEEVIEEREFRKRLEEETEHIVGRSDGSFAYPSSTAFPFMTFGVFFLTLAVSFSVPWQRRRLRDCADLGEVERRVEALERSQNFLVLHQEDLGDWKQWYKLLTASLYQVIQGGPNPLNDQALLHQIHFRKPHQAVSSTTAVSKRLSSLLRHVISTLAKKDAENFRRTGIRRFWIAQNTEDVVRHFRSQKGLSAKGFRTFDFTTMYTQLQHQDLKKKVGEAVIEAACFAVGFVPFSASFAASKSIYLTEKGEWSTLLNLSRGETKVFHLKDILEMISWIVDNTFISNEAGKLRRQKIGLPMGTNCSPELSNLCLYCDEARFIDRL